MDPLAIADDLDGLAGSPFDDVPVDIAGASVRSEAGWHIAPVTEETLSVYSDGSRLLRLPSLRVVEVDEVRTTDAVPIVLTGFTLRSGGLWRSQGWPCGMIEVDLTHGFETCPLDLLPVIAARASGAISSRDPLLAGMSWTTGQRSGSETYRDPGSASMTVVDPVVARYSIHGFVA
jgi:hypothetical protein